MLTRRDWSQSRYDWQCQQLDLPGHHLVLSGMYVFDDTDLLQGGLPV
jgi:hypothetical protein